MWLQQLIQWITTDRSWVSAAIVGEHWVPVVLTKRGSVITLTTTPEGSTLIDAAQQVTVCEGLTLQAHQRMLPTSFHGDFFWSAPIAFRRVALQTRIDTFRSLSADQRGFDPPPAICLRWPRPTLYQLDRSLTYTFLMALLKARCDPNNFGSPERATS